MWTSSPVDAMSHMKRERDYATRMGALYEHHEELNEQYRIKLHIDEVDEKRVVLQKLYWEVGRRH